MKQKLFYFVGTEEQSNRFCCSRSFLVKCGPNDFHTFFWSASIQQSDAFIVRGAQCRSSVMRQSLPASTERQWTLHTPGSGLGLDLIWSIRVQFQRAKLQFLAYQVFCSSFHNTVFVKLILQLFSTLKFNIPDYCFINFYRTQTKPHTSLFAIIWN